MSLKYSSFISYRHNVGDKKFLKEFIKIIKSEAHRVTNIDEVFFDSKSIKLGDNFDEKIYNSIISSHFFIPIYHMTYLHVDNVWCARELYQALEVEKLVRDKIGNSSYCFILPIIHRGELNELPECISKKNAKDIRRLEMAIISNKANKHLAKFKNNLYDVFCSNFQLLSKNSIDFIDLCKDIEIPSDEKIKKWILEQKIIESDAESKKLPILTKNEE